MSSANSIINSNIFIYCEKLAVYGLRFQERILFELQIFFMHTLEYWFIHSYNIDSQFVTQKSKLFLQFLIAANHLHEEIADNESHFARQAHEKI